MQFDHGYPDLVGFGRRSIDASLVRLTRSTSSTDKRPAPAAIDDRTVGLLRARTLAEGHVVSRVWFGAQSRFRPAASRSSLWPTIPYPVVAVLVDDDADRAAQSVPGQQIRIVLCSEVGCHHVKFAAWLSPSTHLPSYRRDAGRSKAAPPGRRCMHRHSTGSELHKLAASQLSRPTT